MGNRGTRRLRVAPTAIVLSAMIALASAATAQAAEEVTAAAGAQALVSVSSDGWIHFKDQAPHSNVVRSQQTQTVTGTPVEGGCSFTSTGSAEASAAGMYEEETAYNPETCQETVLRGELSVGSLEQLAAERPAIEEQEASSASAANVLAAQGSGSSNLTTSYKSAHATTLWVDPLEIVITGFTNDLSWPLAGENGRIGSSAFDYMFKYDHWRAEGPSTPTFSNVFGGFSSDSHSDFYNSDFQALLKKAGGGLTGMVCQHLNQEAHFHQDVAVTGYSSGMINYVSHDTAAGGCSNLVHHVGWIAFGWSNTFPGTMWWKKLKEVAVIASNENPADGESPYAEAPSSAPVSAGSTPIPQGPPTANAWAISRPNLEQSVAYRGADGRIWDDWFSNAGNPGNQWTWRQTRLGGAAAEGNPATILRPNEEQSIFYRGTDGAIWNWWFSNAGNADGAWTWRLTRLGGAAVGEPSAISRPNGEEAVYFRGADGAIWTWWFSNAGNANGEWTWRLNRLGGSAAGNPTAILRPNSEQGVFYRGTDGAIWTWWLSNAGNASGEWTWRLNSLGGQATSDPAALSRPNGEEDVFVRGTDGAMYNYWLSNAGNPSSIWTWRIADLGGGVLGSASAILRANEEMSVYVRGADGAIYNYWLSNAGNPSGIWTWRTTKLGGQASGDPTAITRPNAEVGVFYPGGDGTLHNFWFSNAGNPGGEWTWRLATLPASLSTAPRLSSEAVSGVTNNEATITSLLEPAGLATEYRLEYGRTAAYGQSAPITPAIGANVGTVEVGENLAGLTAGTTYHYRFVATNADGVTASADSTFTTTSLRPVNTSAPTISPSAPHEKEIVRATTGSWSNNPTSYAYQWQNCTVTLCAPIAGATAATYTPTATDVKLALEVVVTATNASGSTSVTSAPTGKVHAIPIASAPAPSRRTLRRASSALKIVSG